MREMYSLKNALNDVLYLNGCTSQYVYTFWNTPTQKYIYQHRNEKVMLTILYGMTVWIKESIHLSNGNCQQSWRNLGAGG